jgi:competence ComEA-like helix-hairpin-helix protein
MPLDTDDAFAWLESLAVRQGANEALLLKPEERTDTPPDWVLQSANQPETQTNPDLQAPPDMARMIGSEDLHMLEQMPAEPEPVQPKEVELPAAAVEAPVVESPPAFEPAPAPSAPQAAAPQPPVAEPVAPKKKRNTGGLPPLPDWLAGAGDSGDETEWTPPPVTKRKYDLNKASLGELERLPGVGFIMAQRIVLFRDQNGAFKNVDELLNVPDFSPMTLEDIRENLFVTPTAKSKTGPLAQPEAPAPAPAPVIIIDDESVPVPLGLARSAFGRGEIGQALTHYAELIQEGHFVNRVVEDLEKATRQHPNDVLLWQTLGDAHLQLNQPAEAIKAYIQAERLLR